MAINHHTHSAFLRPIVTLLLLLCMAVEANAYTYTYYIINKKGWTGLWFKETTQTAGNAPSLPDWMRSPLVEKYYYYDDSRVTHTAYTNGSDGRPTNECYWHDSQYRSDNNKITTAKPEFLNGKYEYNAKTDVLTALPESDANIFVFYDVKSSTTVGDTYIDLTGKSYYNIQDVDDWYVYANELWKDSRGKYQVCSNSLDDLHTWHHRDTGLGNTGSSHDNQSYGDLQYDAAYAQSIQPYFPFMLWRFESVDGIIDPYNFYIKNKMYDVQENFEADKVLGNKDNTQHKYSQSYGAEASYMNGERLNSDGGYYIKRFALIGSADNMHLVSNAIYMYNKKYDYPSIRNFGYRNSQLSDRHKEGIDLYSGSYSNSASDYLTNPKYAIKLTPDKNAIFNLVDLNGRIVLKWRNRINTMSDISVPESLRSPLAKDFTFYKKTAFTKQGDKYVLTNSSDKVTNVTEINNGDEIFVTYAYDDTQNIIDVSGNSVTSIQCNGKYLYIEDNGNTTIKTTDTDQSKSNYRWLLSNSSVNGAVDPYNLLVSNMTNAVSFMSGSTANEALTVSNTNTYYRFALLEDGSGNYSFVASGSSVINSKNDYDHLYVTLNDDGTIILKQQGYDEATTASQHLTFTTHTTSSVTYHVMDLSGNEAISYSVDIVEGDNTISMPSILKSPLAENYTFYSDKECTIPITSLSATTTDIYVKYTSKPNTNFDLSGSTYYIFSLGGKEDEQNRNLSAKLVNGAYDPYSVSIQDINGNKLMDATFCILNGMSDNSYVLMKAKENDADINQYLALSTEGQPVFKEISGAKVTDGNLQATFGRNVTYHFKKLNGDGFRDVTLVRNVLVNETEVMPSALISSFAENYHYYRDADMRQEITDASSLPSDIYVQYTYNENAAVDLSGGKDYFAKDENNNFLYYNGTSLTLVDTDNSTGEILWNIDGKDGGSLIDPYSVAVVNADHNSSSLSTDNNGTLNCNKMLNTYMITATADGKIKFVDLSTDLSSFVLSFTEVTHSTYDYTFYIINKKGWTGLWYKQKGKSSDGKIELPNFMRSQLVSNYHFYTTENVVHKSIAEDATGRPLYKCYYHNGSKLVTGDTDLAVLVGKYEKGSNESKAWPRKNTDIFVFYDVLPDKDRIIDGVHIDLSGKTFYNIQDSQDAYLFMDKRYTMNTKDASSQIWSFEYDKLQKYHSVSTKTDNIMMWSFYSANDDPYDVQIKNKYVSQTYPEQELVVVETGTHQALYSSDGWLTEYGGDNNSSEISNMQGKSVYVLTPEQTETDYDTKGRINSFAFLQGTDEKIIKLAGSINGKSSDDIQCFRFFGLRGYYNEKTGNTYNGAYYGMMRGNMNADVNKYLNNDLYRVKLTEYAKKVTYHVINLSGKEATSVSEFYVAGNPCELNSIVKSPFATNYKYYKAEDVTVADGTITVKEGAQPITTVPENATDIYVTYEYDTANTPGINIQGRNGTILYNIKANSQYLSTNGTNLTVASDASNSKNSIWVIECNMVDGMPDPYDAHIYSWGNCDNYLGGETTLALTDKASSTSFILGRGTSNSLFTIAKATPVVEDENTGVLKLTYLSCDGTSFSFAETYATSTDVQTTLTNQKLKYTYYIINLSNEKSIYKVADDLLAVQIPYELSSPAVEKSAYKYYKPSSFSVDAEGKYRLNTGAVPISQFQDLEDGKFDIYVTYTYNPSTTRYDLTGGTDYNIVMGDGSFACVKSNPSNVYALKPDENNIIKPDKEEYTIYDPRALWTLQGNDPYKVKIYNRSVTDKWMSSNGNYYTGYILLAGTESGYAMNYVAILNMNGGGLRLLGQPSDDNGNWYCFNTNTSNQMVYRQVDFNNIDNTRAKLIRRVKHTYTLHLTSKIDNKEITYEEEMYEDDNIYLPAEMVRHFCTYKFYDSAEKTNEIKVFSEVTNIYADYEVREGIFMADGETPETAPQKVFFLDYGTSISTTYNTLNGHSTITSKTVDEDDKIGDKFKQSTIKSVGSVGNRYSCGSPSDLLWYFSGDPYCCQVYAAKHPGENLVPMSRKEPLNMYEYRRSVEFSSTKYKDLNIRIDEVATRDGKTYEPFHWEMVDGTRGNADDGMSFALRFKEAVGYVVRGYTEGVDVQERYFGQYYYLRPQGGAADDGNTKGSRQLDNNNVDQCALTLRRPARVYATVYNSKNIASPVTRNEISEFVAVGEKFNALPTNLRRKYCTYTLIDPDDMTDLSSETLFEVTKPKYDDNGNLQAHRIYARYEVNAVNPFCNTTTEDGLAVLEDANTKWFNFIIGGNSYVNFDRDYVGKDADVNDNDHRITRANISLSKDAEGNYILPKSIMHKGLHWAFVGDPYRFYVVGHRHRTATYDVTGYKMTAGEVGYLDIGNQREICMSADREYFTFMLDATDGNDPQKYFMSFSTPRLTEQTGYGNSDIVQGIYTDGGNRNGFKASYGDNYSRGTNVTLQRVKAETDATEEAAQAAVFGQAVGNDVFDCILNVYNGENKVVASSGWTELLRSDAVNAKSLPLDIQRYGCTYKCWGDATMTKKQVARYDEKMRRGDRWDYDGSGNPDEEIYVLDDGCFIYTNYSYDTKNYSSDNNYHWVNCRFDWEETTARTSVWSFSTKSWEEDGKTETGETKQYRHWGDEWESKFDPLQDEKVSYERYISSKEAPATEPSNGIVDEKVFGDREGTDRDDDDKKDGMLWALVGDPYEFQLKSYLFRESPYENYYLKVKDNSGYLYTKEQAAVDYNINNRPADQPLESTLTPAQKQGFTFTYKVDADGLPYLAQKDESATALSRKNKDDILVGAVKNYVTFNFSTTSNYREPLAEGYSAEVNGTTYYKGTKYTVDYSSISGKTEADQYEEEQWPFTDMKGTTEIGELKYSFGFVDESERYTKTVGGMSTDENKLNTGGAKNFYVEPMTATAKSVVFRLKYYREDNKEERPGGSNGKTMSELGLDKYFTNGKEYPVTLRPKIDDDYLAKDYEVKEYGVGTSLLLPWSYRRQYCTYYYRLVDVLTTENSIDFTSVKDREDIQPYIGKYYDILDEKLADYKLIFDVYYQTTEDYEPSTSADDAFWYNLTTTSVNTGEIEPVNFSYFNNMHKGERKNHYTDDWLWAVEGDPYGMKLHNRYAQTWDEVLTIPTIPVAVNVTNDIDTETGESIITGNYSVIIQDPSSRGSYSTVNNTTPSTSTDENDKTIYYNSHFFEMMQGNYSTAFLLHPIYAEIQSVYPAYFLSMFLFNAGDWPVQLNEMLDREAKRNAAANWTLQPLAADQLLPYYDRAGYVGALTPDKATEDEVKTLFGKLKDGSATYADLKQAQKIVHNKANLVPLKKGYYRIKAMSDEALTAYEADKTQYSGTRYASAFLTKSELSEDGKSSALPLNFWATLADNQGDLNYSDLPADQLNQSFNRELLAAEYDPSSIFHFVPTLAEGETVSDQTKWTVTSQGINISNIPYIDDIGGTLFTMRSSTDMKTGYLNCSPDTKRFALNTGTNNELHEKYDIQDTKWLLQPVGDQGYAMPLKFETLDGGDGYKYCSAYLSHDIQLSDGAEAWVAAGEPYENGERKIWEVLCKKISDNASFVPALTPVIIRCPSDEKLYATIPTDAPTATSYAPSPTSPLYGSLFAREVGDEKLATESEKKAVDAGNEVYVFGKANDTVDFYLNGNANPHNANAFDTKYLYHNKAFLIQTPDINASALRVCVPVFSNMSSGIDNVYVDDDKGKGPIYDLLGRKVKKTKRGVYIQKIKKIKELKN